MQRQRGELVPVGDALSDLVGPVQAFRDASPQAARHCFTQADQVNLLVSAREADPDRGFMARLESRLDGRISGLESQFGELRERMAKLEGLLEGLREAITGRAAVR